MRFMDVKRKCYLSSLRIHCKFTKHFFLIILNYISIPYEYTMLKFNINKLHLFITFQGCQTYMFSNGYNGGKVACTLNLLRIVKNLWWIYGMLEFMMMVKVCVYVPYSLFLLFFMMKQLFCNWI